MNQLLIENIEDGIRFVLRQKATSIFVKLVLLVVTLGTLSIPVVVFLSDGVTKGVVLAAMICAALSIYFLRLFLWNSYGKEIFEIHPQRILHYTDYRFFKDEFLDEKDLINISFFIENEALIPDISNEKTLPDVQLNTDKEAFVFIILRKDQELTRSNVKLSKEKAAAMLVALKEQSL